MKTFKRNLTFTGTTSHAGCLLLTFENIAPPALVGHETQGHGAVAFILYIDIILCRAGISLNFPKNVAPFLLVYQDYFAHIEIVIPPAPLK